MNGKGLYGWIRDYERFTRHRILADVSRWGHARGYPVRVLDWTEAEVGEARAYIDTIVRLKPEWMGIKNAHV